MLARAMLFIALCLMVQVELSTSLLQSQSSVVRRTSLVNQHTIAVNTLHSSPIVALSRTSLHGSVSSVISASKLKSFTPKLAVLIALVTTWKSKAVQAAPKTLRGWDLYGRVPYDDWLFSNDKLLDPNLLRPSFVEAITKEVPDAFASFTRRKVINEAIKFVRGVGYVGIGSIVIATLFVVVRNFVRSNRET